MTIVTVVRGGVPGRMSDRDAPVKLNVAGDMAVFRGPRPLHRRRRAADRSPEIRREPATLGWARYDQPETHDAGRAARRW